MGLGFTEECPKRPPARAKRGFLDLVSFCVPLKPHLCPEKLVQGMLDALIDNQCGLRVTGVPELGAYLAWPEASREGALLGYTTVIVNVPSLTDYSWPRPT